MIDTEDFRAMSARCDANGQHAAAVRLRDGATEIDGLRAKLAAVTRERDEALAEVARLKADVSCVDLTLAFAREIGARGHEKMAEAVKALCREHFPRDRCAWKYTSVKKGTRKS